MSASYDILVNIANKCKAANACKVFSVKNEHTATIISGEVMEMNTPQKKKAANSASEIKPKNAQEEILLGACKLVFNEVPSTLMVDTISITVEEALIRKAQLAELRR